MPTAMDSATAQAGTSTTPQTVSASVLKAGALAATNTVYLSSSNTASQNTAVIQAALNSAGEINITGDGTFLVNDTLRYYSNSVINISKDVILKQAPNTDKNMLIANGYYDTGTAVTLTWNGTSETVSVAWTGHGKNIGEPVWLTGANQSQYSGIFFVKSVTNANTIVVFLKRLPKATPTGTVYAKTPVTNVTINCYGLFDYDRVNNFAAPLDKDRHAVVLSGIFTVNCINIQNAAKFALCIVASRQSSVKNVNVPISFSDAVKIYGQTFELDISNVRGNGAGNGDDFLTIHTREMSIYLGGQIYWGDCLDIKATNIYPVSNTVGRSISLYASPNDYMSGIILEDFTIADKFNLGTFPEGGVVGSVTLKNFSMQDDTYVANPIDIGSSGPLTMDTLTIEGFTSNSMTNGNACVFIRSAVTINKLNITKCFYESSLSGYFLLTNGSIGILNINNCSVQSTGTASTTVKCIGNAGNIGLINVENNNFRFTTTMVDGNSGTIGKINYYKNNHFACLGALNLATSTSMDIVGNTGQIGGWGIVRLIGGVGVSYKITSSGNQSLAFDDPANKIVKDTCLVSWNGTDIPIPLSALTRTVAGQMVTAYASTGSGGATDILANNVCINDATNTTGSWKQLSAPTTRVY